MVANARRFSVLAVLALALLPALTGGQADAHKAAAAVWGCPMCETIRQTDPGTCPICKMDLVSTGPGAGIDTAADPERVGMQGPSSAAGAGPSHAGNKPLMPGLPNSLF